MKAHRAAFTLAAMCRVLGLSPSGYHDWLDRRRSQRTRRDDELRDRIEGIWRESDETYGSPRIHAALRAEGERVGRKRVARLMKALGIEGITRRRFRTGTTKRDAEARPAPDLVKRDFSADGPDRLWVADITYVPTWAGWLYLAVVLDAWSRRIVGWAMAPQMPAALVEEALAMAIARRQLQGGVVHHSDRGSQYTSLSFGKRCREAGVVQSMGSVGDAYDNAMCESFFASLECELLDRPSFATVREARREIFRFIEGFYNTRRLHSALGYVSPATLRETQPCGLKRTCSGGATEALRASPARSFPQARSSPLPTPERGENKPHQTPSTPTTNRP